MDSSYQLTSLLPSFNVSYMMSPRPKKQSHTTSPPQDNDLLSRRSTRQVPSPPPTFISTTAPPSIDASPAAANPALDSGLGEQHAGPTNSSAHPRASMGPPGVGSSFDDVQQQSTLSTTISESPAPLRSESSPGASVSAPHEASIPRPFPSPRGSSAGPSYYDQVRSPSGRSSLASTEPQSRSSRRTSRSPELGQRTSTSSAGAGGLTDSTGQATRVRRRPKTQVASACWKCKKDHLSCDVSRPCKRCVNSGQQEYCYDVPPKKRGRPKLDQRVEPESSSAPVNRKRQRHTYFEIDPANALPGAGPSDSYSRSAQAPPSSYHYGHHHTPSSDPSMPRSSYSSVRSFESGDPSSRPSRESARSLSSNPGREYSTRSNSTASSNPPPPPPGYPVSSLAQPSPHAGRSPAAAYNLTNLAASLPPSSPAVGSQFGLPSSHYRPPNPANPQNFGTRPRPFPSGPTSSPFTASSRDQPGSSSSIHLPPVAPFQGQPPPGYGRYTQLEPMQPRVQLHAPDASASFSRTAPLPSSATSAGMQSMAPRPSSRAGHGRYDPVQDASRSREAREGRSHGTRHRAEETASSSRRHDSDHSSGRSGNEGNGDSRKQRRQVKLSDIVH